MRRKSSLRQIGEFDADREAALQLGHQVGGLGQVERPGGDEQDVIGPHRSVLGVDRRSFDDRQQIALHALARHIRAVPGRGAADLVEFVEEDDPLVFDQIDRLLDRPPPGRSGPRSPAPSGFAALR